MTEEEMEWELHKEKVRIQAEQFTEDFEEMKKRTPLIYAQVISFMTALVLFAITGVK